MKSRHRAHCINSSRVWRLWYKTVEDETGAFVHSMAGALSWSPSIMLSSPWLNRKDASSVRLAASGLLMVVFYIVFLYCISIVLYMLSLPENLCDVLSSDFMLLSVLLLPSVQRRRVKKKKKKFKNNLLARKRYFSRTHIR